MICLKCNTPNPEEAQFCISCGASFVPAPAQPLTEKQPKSKKNWKWLVIGGGVVLLLLFVGVWLVAGTKKETETTVPKKSQTTSTSAIGAPSPTPTPPTVIEDSDGDGLTDKEEEKYGTSPYLSDTDGDGAPDKAEIETGYDPLVDDCAVKAGCEGERAIVQKDINTLFILDASGSMAQFVSGKSKMETAKEALKDYVDGTPPEVNLGLMVYGHHGSNSTADKAVSCTGIDLLYPISKVDKTEFKAKVDSFSPTGWTPIGGSFQKAKSDAFTGMDGENNQIILVSDGIETCDTDPCAIAKELKESGIKTTIDVIGFAVDAQARNQLECIARVTGGKYFHAQTAEQFKESFNNLSMLAQETVEKLDCLSKHTKELLNCLNEKSMKLIDWSVKKGLGKD